MISHFKSFIFCILGALLVLVPSTVLANRNISIPSFKAQPNGTVSVPIILDKAESLASIKIQVNFDRQILDFVSAQASGVGAAFEFVSSEDDGVITLMFSRSASLLQGVGKLAILNFHVNAGAQVGMSSALTIASCEFSDDSGVRNLNLDELVIPNSGKISITLGSVDNNNNKIPDDWEAAHGLSTIDDESAQLTPGGSAHTSFAFGIDPAKPDLKRLPDVGIDTVDQHLTLQFHRRRNAGIMMDYLVEESTDLISWASLDTTANQVGTPVVEDADFELVTVHGNQVITPSSGTNRVFMRVKVLYH